MILPRACTPAIPGDFGHVWISESITLSKPDGLLKVRSLFERQSTATRQQNGRKGAATQMAMKFARLLTNGRAIR